MSSRLEQIIATHRAQAAADNRYVSELLEIAEESAPTRPFEEALQMGPHLSIIAEIKRRSPSMGDLNLGLDPATLAKEYESAGASCLSVLTDQEFFGAQLEDLEQARAAVSLPVLRKDFTVCECNVVDARIMGADAILLIVAALEDEELWKFARLAEKLDLAALFEVHNEEEIERALRANASIIGVNQRDLHTFEIDTELAVQLHEKIPTGVTTVAESGIKSADDIAKLAEVGYDAALIGTSLVTSESIAESLRGMAEAGRR